MRILVVEDDTGIAQFLQQGLNEAGYAVDVAEDGNQGLEYALSSEYDVLIIDIQLPYLNGLDLLKTLRSEGIKSPVLLLTARSATQDRVMGLDVGADDYLVKPFDFSELLARVRALLRRPPLQNNLTLQVGDLEMDIPKRLVSRNKQPIDLSPREFSLLEYLMRHPDQVLSRTQIAQHVWSFDFYSDFKVIDVYIGYLRRKIERQDGPFLIKTVRGIGYCISAGVESYRES
ncbi:MAG: response regulator transcription factor [Cyanobacteria bacterium P01_F01_bin.86]